MTNKRGELKMTQLYVIQSKRSLKRDPDNVHDIKLNPITTAVNLYLAMVGVAPLHKVVNPSS